MELKQLNSGMHGLKNRYEITFFKNQEQAFKTTRKL